MWLNVPGLGILCTIVMGCGVGIYASYRGCDPLLTGDVTTTSQLIAFFVKQARTQHDALRFFASHDMTYSILY